MVYTKFLAHLLPLTASVSLALAEEATLSPEELLNACRQNPTWNNSDGTISYESCKSAWNFDTHEEDFLSNTHPEFEGGRESAWFKKMQSCMDEKIAKRPKYETEDSALQEPKVLKLYPDEEEPTLALVDNVITDEEAATFLDLSDCVKQNHPRQFVRRSFAGADEDFEVEGGNDCTFVGGFLQLFAPGVAAKMCQAFRAAWKAAQWYTIVDDPEMPFMMDPCHMGVRTAEFLSYEPSGWSALGGHTDIDTMYTMLLLLADPSEYEGGEFYFKPYKWGGEDQDEKIVFKPKRKQALIFLGDLEWHGVQTITKGRRRATTVELWGYGNSPIGVNRPQTDEFYDFVETGSYEGNPSYDGHISSNPKTQEYFWYEGEGSEL